MGCRLARVPERCTAFRGASVRSPDDHTRPSPNLMPSTHVPVLGFAALTPTYSHCHRPRNVGWGQRNQPQHNLNASL